MKLNQILKSINVISVYNENNTEDNIGNIDVKGISYHSKKVSNGELFVCIKGYKTDGHKYLSQAAKKGAVAAVVEEFQKDINIPQYFVENSRIALAKLGADFYNNPSKSMNIIGITATNGKTTTSYMTNAILENHNLKTGLIGTVVVKMDDESIPSELTTPQSLDLQYYLNRMIKKDVSHVTMEVSSSALELHRVENVDFDIVSLGNISREHIDIHGSFENYVEFKSSLIKNAKEGSYAVLNLDCPYSADLVNKTKAEPITFSAKNRNGHIYCKNLDLTTGRGRFSVEIIKPFKANNIEYFPMEFDIELSVPGLHSVYNSMTAITIALICGIPMTVIQDTLRNFSSVERRFEFIYEDGFKIIDDHFANPGNINITLETLDFMEYKKLHLVYAIRGERGTVVNKENSEAIVKWKERLGLEEIIATKSVSHVTEKDMVTDDELNVFLEVMSKANIKVHLYDELTDAVAHSIDKVQEGDLILLAGCQGMDYGAEIGLQQIYEKNGEYSKEELFQALKNRVAGISSNNIMR